MLLTIEDMIKLLRSSVNIQYTEDGVSDSAYLSMTDEDIKMFIKLGCSRAFPNISDLEELEEGSEYPIVILAKIELYLKLAVIKSDLIDLGADGAYLKQSQRFDHYMTLVEEARQEYNSWVENESIGNNTVSSYNVLLSKRHYTNRNYELTPTPKVLLKIENITNNSVELHWKVSNTSHFGRYKVYISESPIIDICKDGAKLEDKVVDGAKLVKITSNIRDSHIRLDNLLPNTNYYVAVASVERNLVFGFSEKSFTTLEEYQEEDNFEIGGSEDTNLGGDE